jgi:hypothetical protein
MRSIAQAHELADVGIRAPSCSGFIIHEHVQKEHAATHESPTPPPMVELPTESPFTVEELVPELCELGVRRQTVE